MEGRGVMGPRELYGPTPSSPGPPGAKPAEGCITHGVGPWAVHEGSRRSSEGGN